MSHVVFVGLGFGGLNALKRFIKHTPDGVRITAIDRRGRFVFTPLRATVVGVMRHDEVGATGPAGGRARPRRPWRGS